MAVGPLPAWVKWLIAATLAIVIVGLSWLGLVARNEAALDRCIATSGEVRRDFDASPVVKARWRWWPPGHDCEYRYSDGVMIVR